MGRQVDRGALFYEVRLEERIPAGHLLRRIDAILDLSFVHELMAPLELTRFRGQVSGLGVPERARSD